MVKSERGANDTHEPGGKALSMLADMTSSAEFGGPLDCYRYSLERRWSEGPAIMFVLMNPSCADSFVDDRTTQRVTHMVRKWKEGFGGLLIGNVFAYRASDQKRLAAVEDPIGSDNDAAILKLAEQAKKDRGWLWPASGQKAPEKRHASRRHVDKGWVRSLRS